MPVYVVERNLPGITIDRLAEVQRAVLGISQRFTEEGNPVRYIRCTYIPEESRCMCLFEATNVDIVEQVNEEAHIPYTRVLEAIDIDPTS